MTLETKLFLQHQGCRSGERNARFGDAVSRARNRAQGGHVDAIVDTDPFTQQAEKQFGFVPIGFPSKEVPAGTSTAGYYATSAWLASHGDVARRFARAYRRAAQWANAATPEQKAEVLAKFSPVNLKALESEVPGIVKSFHYQVFNDGPLDVEVTQSWNDLAVKFGGSR